MEEQQEDTKSLTKVELQWPESKTAAKSVWQTRTAQEKLTYNLHKRLANFT